MSTLVLNQCIFFCTTPIKKNKANQVLILSSLLCVYILGRQVFPVAVFTYKYTYLALIPYTQVSYLYLSRYRQVYTYSRKSINLSRQVGTCLHLFIAILYSLSVVKNLQWTLLFLKIRKKINLQTYAKMVSLSHRFRPSQVGISCTNRYGDGLHRILFVTYVMFPSKNLTPENQNRFLGTIVQSQGQKRL